MKNLDDILNLITGDMNPDDKREAFSRIKGNNVAETLFIKAKLTWALMSSTRKVPDSKVEEAYQLLHKRIFTQRNSLNLYSFFRYAAILILLVGVPVLTFYIGKQNSVSSNSSLKYTTVVAENGQISKIILPDSSIVWLNSGTTLTYDNNYSFKNRNLDLKGQAFLEVRKNKNLPLIVASGNLRVKVLGTRFDVNAYPADDHFKVTLESGHVELLNSSDKSFKYKLNPGEMADYELASGKLEITPVKSQNYVSWKNGELNFVDTPMAEVIKRLERKFNVEIEVVHANVYNSVFNANFKNENLKEILEYIKFSCPITYQLIQEKDSIQTKVILNKKSI
ncbi:MAG TPA: FecR domain-containing protein [Prolixibacteraceae bacterium]|nr:FecR domain-containing protein [Prolixibacteraceae bacterium]